MQWAKERRTPLELANEIQKRELEEAMAAKKREELMHERNATAYAPPSEKKKGENSTEKGKKRIFN